MLNSKENIDLTNINSFLPTTVFCLCGCGRTLPGFDDHGRLRRYIVGHNRRGKRSERPNYLMLYGVQNMNQAESLIHTLIKIVDEYRHRNEDLQKRNERLEEDILRLKDSAPTIEHTRYLKENSRE